MPETMITGGRTDQVRNAGGQELYISLAIACSGQRLDVSVYAVTRLLGSLGLFFDDLDDAKAFLTRVAADATNELDLNWDDRKTLLAQARAAVPHGGRSWLTPIRTIAPALVATTADIGAPCPAAPTPNCIGKCAAPPSSDATIPHPL